MADLSSSSGGMGGAVCEVCAQPMPSGTPPVRVGACEFPFHVHDACLEHMGPLAAEITEMCAAAAPDEQPEGLLWLGSWDPEPVHTESATDERADR
jgi:hypothetical protein